MPRPGSAGELPDMKSAGPPAAVQAASASGIEAALLEQEQGQKALARRFHELEDLRDDMLAVGVKGVDAALQRFPNADRQRLRQLLMQAGKEIFERGADIDMVAISWPQQVYEKEARQTMTYSDQMTLNFNGHTIEIRNYGPAHTTGDSFIFFRESNVLHMGDVANLTGLPYIDAGNGGTVDGMIYSIKKALQMTDENTVVVPGHGEISGREDLEIYLAKIELVRNRVFNMIEEGMNLQDILQADPASEVFPSSPFDAGFGIPASHTFVDRAYASMTKK